jgi:putative ABC transport system permease protein
MLPPQGQRIVDPNKHFFQDIMDGIFFVLGVMAVLALFLGLFLVYNTINAIISQQVDQIGVMKAIGASSWQILRIYLLYVLAFGVLALLFAVPLGMAAGWQLNVFLMDSFNAQAEGFQISWTAVFVQIIIALVTPLLVAAVPVISGARITVREAISTYGLSTSLSYLDRLLAKLKRVSRLLLLTISNTFRNKWRVILTQITLVLSGLIFMMVMSVGDSTNYTFNDLLFSILNSNINLGLEESERISAVESLTMQHPNVAAVEMWAFGGGSAHLQTVESTDDDPEMLVFGVPSETDLYGYQMRAGRWLTADDTHAIVLNEELADELGVGLGDWVTFDQGTEGESDWQVVGLLFDPLITNSAHVPRTTLLREQNSVGRTNSVWVQLKLGTPAAEETAVRELRQLYEDNGISVQPGGILAGQDTSSEIVSVFNTQFRSITALLSVMAVVIGVVGSISLSGVLSLSVIERQREIGVMRAVGASSWDIACMFIGEGLILGVLSWVIALPFSLPAGQIITNALSGALGIDIVYFYTPKGAITWFIIITVLSTLASWIPARRATRISVRDSLAYL